jgi:flagellum-specific peptidoglycan hydrolase FlgJ
VRSLTFYMDQGQQNFLDVTSKGAEDAGAIFPSMQACEAALESGYGSSELARDAFNLFGTKQHTHPEYGTLNLPTKEFLDDKWVACEAEWVKYPSLADCFADRMATLQRLAPHYPHYAAALAAPDAETFVSQVSLTWSTDPQRAAKVLSIWNQYMTVGK